MKIYIRTCPSERKKILAPYVKLFKNMSLLKGENIGSASAFKLGQLDPQKKNLGKLGPLKGKNIGLL